MINYKERQVESIGLVVDVYLIETKLGSIYRVVGGWQFQSLNKDLGGVYASVENVKRVLEGKK